MERIRKILIVDDEESTREFMQMFFEDREYMVDCAVDGEEGLDKAWKTQYDLILCDMMMPRMPGFTFLKKIRENFPEQKVIMLTGVTEESLKHKIDEIGCSGYLVKPVKLSELEECVNRCLNPQT